MKYIYITYIILSISRIAFAQNDEGKKIEYQFKIRTAFPSVNERYNLRMDTIYHANDGFRVYSGYDIQNIKGIDYYIFSYQNWGRKGQIRAKETKKDMQNKSFLSDSTLKIIISKGHELFDDLDKKTIESLRNLAEKEILKDPVHINIKGKDSLKLAIRKDTFEKLKLEGKIDDVYSLRYGATKLASGFMTIPFKLRPKQDTINFNMTTDVTLGAYIGIKQRISRKQNNFIVVPFTLGLSYINVGNSETSKVKTEGNSSIVPGWTWSTGLVFDLNGVNIGFVLGQDFASGVGNKWLYNKKLWYSFSIGYSFFNKSSK